MASNAKKDRKQSSKKGDEAAKKRKPGELSRFQKIVIVAFIVIFALSTLAGALASVMQTQTAEDASEESQETTVETVDGNYEGIVQDLESKVAENPEDKASLLRPRSLLLLVGRQRELARHHRRGDLARQRAL